MPLADFLAAADEHHLADDEHSFTAWVERHGTRHVRVKQLRLREVKDGDRIVCIRSVLDALRQMPESQPGDRWAYLARTLAAKEACILEQLQKFAGGTEQDAEIVRTGVRAMQHDLEGEALKREYERQRSALAAVERRIERFFKAARSSATPSAE